MKFTRQKPLGGYIVDFYCAERRLAIVIDGDTHDAQQQQDETRTHKLNAMGIEVIRYTNAEIMNNLEGVYESLMKHVTERRLPQPRDRNVTAPFRERESPLPRAD